MGLRFFVNKNMVMAAFRKSLLKVSGNALHKQQGMGGISKETEENWTKKQQ